MARLSFEYCQVCRTKTNWIDGKRCCRCGYSWFNYQEGIRKRERDKIANQTGRLAAEVDFVTMKPMKKIVKKG